MQNSKNIFWKAVGGLFAIDLDKNILKIFILINLNVALNLLMRVLNTSLKGNWFLVQNR